MRKELFHPSDPTNAATDERLVQLARVAAQGILDSYTIKRRQRGSICPYRDCISHIRDAHQMFGMNCLGEMKRMIEVRVPGRGSGPEFSSVFFFSGGRPNFSKLLEEQKNRQTLNKERPIF